MRNWTKGFAPCVASGLRPVYSDMQSPLAEALAVKIPPVAIILTEQRPSDATQFKPGRFGCVASMLLTAAKGRTVAFDRDTFGCPGGGAGLGFGDCYERMGFPIERLLSTGGTAQLRNGQSYDMHEGERFHRTPEITRRWLAEFPFREIPTAYVVAKPLSGTAEDEPVALVHWHINPDQLGALITLAGFQRGTVETATAPWGAACQAIAFAYAEAERPRPRGVIGFFDISQRRQVDREILSFTVPYALHREMEAAIPDSFLRTEAWQKLRARQ
jgi:uncharacterized protein (DUF169 family)